ncbi:unnamed protein product [Litomosoides sigmodontis]|uniref:Uncharacterized protein n=1 Tax=Litomosoides sigmodontis TaxID=42156 RepID=A0A3P6SU34_LITSI|nr:unnamed protein product [Litomosoides sigmodontis]
MSVLLVSSLLLLLHIPIVEVATLAPNHAAINLKRKLIDADTSWLEAEKHDVQKVSLDASNPEKVILHLINSNKRLSASAQGNVAAAESNGQRAQVQRFGDKGGIAQVEGHKGQIKTKEDDEGRHAFLKADGKYTLDTAARGSLKDAKDTDFVATNEQFDFALNPQSQNEHEGTGTLSYTDKEKGKSGKYAYTIKKDNRKVDAYLSADSVSDEDEFSQSLFSRRSEKYHCTAETPGISQCYDAQGRSVGKVVADKSGNTVIYNDKDVPIATGSVQRINNHSYQAVISKNLFIAKLKDARTSPCCREITGKNCTDPIKLANPSFSHPSERDGDTLKLTWPDCVDMSIDVTLPPKVHINRLAMKLDVMIQPIGKLRCMDVATCGRECYYCDWKLKLLENTDGNLCRATEERTYRLTVKLCPPPEDPLFTLCSAFSKSVWQKDYWQKQGAVDMEKEFFAQLDNPLLGKAFKLAMIAEWLAANSIDQGSYTPTNSELLEYWVSKRVPDRLLACQHAVVDYEIEGAKVKTNLLFEAATTANSLPNIFKDKRCSAFEKLQESRFQAEAAEYKRKNGRSSILSGLGNFLSGINNHGR